MRWLAVLLIVSCSSAYASSFSSDYDDEVYPQPEQIHLSYGADPTQMIVTWVTQSPTKNSVVEFGPKADYGVKFTRRALGNMTIFEDSGTERRKLYIHRVVLQNLAPGVTFYYHCGDPLDGWSAVFWFQALSDDASFDPRLLIYGDMGNKNGRAISLLQQEVQTGSVDAVFHVGDFAYDLADDNARRGDEFMRQIEPIAAYVPYQVCPGNHEYHYNFSNYEARFSMYNMQQNNFNNHYHSFNVGPVHVVSISTEFYFFLMFGSEQIQYQYEWLINDLQEANKPENRQKRPWIFMLAHRPMYCTNVGNSDCFNLNSITRSGLPFTQGFALEPVLKKFGVDILWTGHQHSYERLWPVFNGTVTNGTEAPYSSPNGPVHIITGSPGCEEELTPFGEDKLGISAFHSAEDYTYSRVHVANKTHIFFEQVAVPKGTTIDAITITKKTAFPEWQDPEFPLESSVRQ